MHGGFTPFASTAAVPLNFPVGFTDPRTRFA
jgi:hypothetical protein